MEVRMPTPGEPITRWVEDVTIEHNRTDKEIKVLIEGHNALLHRVLELEEQLQLVLQLMED